MDTDYSKTAFLQFLRFISDKGLVKPKTASSLRGAASRLLEDLSEREEADIRTVDIEIAARKLVNRSSTPLKPETLTFYKRRVERARREFLAWCNDPAGYESRTIMGRERNARIEQTKAMSHATAKEAFDTPIILPEAPVTSGGLPLSFPLRPDFLVQIVIPRDLKSAEARRLGAFLNTLASDYDTA